MKCQLAIVRNEKTVLEKRIVADNNETALPNFYGNHDPERLDSIPLRKLAVMVKVNPAILAGHSQHLV
jgi:hypothetical protein